MPKIVYSSLVSEISGTLGGVTFARPAPIPTIRAKQRRRVSETAADLAARANMRRVVSAWRSMTSAERAAWQTLAQTLRRPTTGRRGIAPSGYQFFLQHNLELARAGLELDTSDLPVVTDVSSWTGIVLTGATTSSLPLAALAPIFGPFPQLAVYAQYVIPARDFAPVGILKQPTRPVPKRWRYIEYQARTTGAEIDIAPAVEPVLGKLQTGLQILVLARYVEKGVIASREFMTVTTL